jgi:GntR family transcriptional regulator
LDVSSAGERSAVRSSILRPATELAPFPSASDAIHPTCDGMPMRIHHQPTPIYFRLKSILKKSIEDGFWSLGDTIPPERTIAQQYQVSVGTVRQAISQLVDEGYLYRVQGKGTFVRETGIPHDHLRYYAFIPDFEDPVPPIVTDLLSRRVVRGSERATRLLQQEPGRDLFEIKRRILVHRKPMVFSLSYLPCDLFKGLGELPDEAFYKEALYRLIEKHFGRPTIRNRELFSVEPAGADAKKHLSVELRSPVLQIEMLSYTFNDQPYEYRLSYCRTDSRRILRTI